MANGVKEGLHTVQTEGVEACEPSALAESEAAGDAVASGAEAEARPESGADRDAVPERRGKSVTEGLKEGCGDTVDCCDTEGEPLPLGASEGESVASGVRESGRAVALTDADCDAEGAAPLVPPAEGEAVGFRALPDALRVPSTTLAVTEGCA